VQAHSTGMLAALQEELGQPDTAWLWSRLSALDGLQTAGGKERQQEKRGKN